MSVENPNFEQEPEIERGPKEPEEGEMSSLQEKYKDMSVMDMAKSLPGFLDRIYKETPDISKRTKKHEEFSLIMDQKIVKELGLKKNGKSPKNIEELKKQLDEKDKEFHQKIKKDIEEGFKRLRRQF